MVERKLLDFYADWCPPCRKMKEVIDGTDEVEGLEKELIGKVIIQRIDVNNDDGESDRLGIMSIPTFVALEDDVEIARIRGFTPKDKMLEWLRITFPDAGI